MNWALGFGSAPATKSALHQRQDNATLSLVEIGYEELRVTLPLGGLHTAVWTPVDALEAPAIVLLHDSIGSVELWREFPEQLARRTRRRVVAYDRLGYGMSDPDPRPLGPDFLHIEAQSLEPLFQQLGLDHAVLLGHSIGAETALTAATLLPQRIAAVIAEAGQMFLEPCTLVAIRRGRETFSDPEQFAKLARYHGDKTEWVLEAWTGWWLSAEMRDWTMAPLLPAVTCPVLVLHGENDEFSTPAQPQLICDNVAGPCELRELPGCGHFPHRENPELVLEHVATFLDGLAGPG